MLHVQTLRHVFNSEHFYQQIPSFSQELEEDSELSESLMERSSKSRGQSMELEDSVVAKGGRRRRRSRRRTTTTTTTVSCGDTTEYVSIAYQVASTLARQPTEEVKDSKLFF